MIRYYYQNHVILYYISYYLNPFDKHTQTDPFIVYFLINNTRFRPSHFRCSFGFHRRIDLPLSACYSVSVALCTFVPMTLSIVVYIFFYVDLGTCISGSLLTTSLLYTFSVYSYLFRPCDMIILCLALRYTIFILLLLSILYCFPDCIQPLCIFPMCQMVMSKF